MAARYPDYMFGPSPYVLADNNDIVRAEHVNQLRDEVVAIETVVGLDPSLGAESDGRYVLTGKTRDYGTVKDRLDRVERAAYRDFDALYVSRRGGSTIARINPGERLPGLSIEAEDGRADTAPALEILSHDRQGGPLWEHARTAVALWNSGRVDAVLYTLPNGRLEESGLTLGPTRVGADGTASIGPVTIGEDAALDVASDDEAVVISAPGSGRALQVVDSVNGEVRVELLGSGRVDLDGSIGLDPAVPVVTVGRSSLGDASLNLGGEATFSSAAIVLGVPGVTASMRLERTALRFFDSAGEKTASIGFGGVAFGPSTIFQDRMTLKGNKGTFFLSTATGEVSMAGSPLGLSSTQGVSMRASTSSVDVSAAGVAITSAGTLVSRAGGATSFLEDHAHVGPRITVRDEDNLGKSGSYLSLDTLRIGSYVALSGSQDNFSRRSAALVVENGGTIRIGPTKGTYLAWGDLDSMQSYVEVTAKGTTISGALSLPDHETTVWPRSETNATVWLHSRPRNHGVWANDLRPTYWEGLHISGTLGSNYVPSAFTFRAPITGSTKITLQAEVAGAVSRSALSYAIWPASGTWANKVLDCGMGHAVSFNAPEPDVEGDIFYVNLSNTAVYDTTVLKPGVEYVLWVLGQRSIPGRMAVATFPRSSDPNWNDPNNYPWGKAFPITHLRVIIEPVVSRVTGQVVPAGAIPPFDHPLSAYPN